MKKYTDELIKIFSQCKINELGKNTQYQKLCRKYGDQSSFNLARQQIEDIKARLEKEIDNKQLSTKQQVIEALRILNQFILDENKEKLDLCYSLIKKTYSQNWTSNQQEHFEKYSDALENHMYYFFSFTDRNYVDDDEENYINKQHKFLIRHILGSEYDHADKRKNLLATAINKLLMNDPNIVRKKGYFYHDKQGDSKVVETELKEACAKSFVFIQLIQNIMFHKKPNEEKSPCCLEYEYARDSKKLDTSKFLFAEGSYGNIIKVDNVPDSYREWYEDIKSRSLLEIEPIESYKRKDIQNQKEKIVNRLVKEIDTIKWKIIAKVPD